LSAVARKFGLNNPQWMSARMSAKCHKRTSIH